MNNNKSPLEHELKRNYGSRIHLAGAPAQVKGTYVLLWVQQAVRIRNNHALAAAVQIANSLELPLYAYYGLFPRYPGANARHFAFLLQGLIEMEAGLENSGIPLVLDLTEPPEGIKKALQQAAWLVCDSGYTTIQRKWRKQLLDHPPCPLAILESDIVVPAAQVSGKEEYAAATIRPKIRRLTDLYLSSVHVQPLKNRRSRLQPIPFPTVSPLRPADALHNLTALGVDMSTGPVDWLQGGEAAGETVLRKFIAGALRHYHDSRNDPGLDIQSELSPYLHFGQISPVTAALEVMEASSEDPSLMEGASGFLEQLIIRRELAINFVLHNPSYDSPESVPEWAALSLDSHSPERRDEPYSYEQMLAGETGDPYWNAAQHELLKNGKIHGYMRMYWGKKVLEWTGDWRDAFRTLIEWNDTYSLDGRDPNGYAGIAWVFGKHDRPFPERQRFGKVRSMVARGLQRKFEMDLYLSRYK